MYINIHMHIKMRVNISTTQYPPQKKIAGREGAYFFFTPFWKAAANCDSFGHARKLN